MEWSVSLLNANWTQLATVVSTLKTAGINRLHLDIMDGHLTSQISFGAPFCRWLKPFQMHLSGHFMVQIPAFQTISDYLANYLGVLDSYLLHYEALSATQIRALIAWKNQYQQQVGLAIQLGTDWRQLQPYLADLDLVLVMLVPIGQGGQKLTETALETLNSLINYCRQQHPTIRIIADGGINATTAPLLPSALTEAVVGSYCWKGSSIQQQIATLKLASK